MTIIDFHSHIGETVGKSMEDLLRSMDAAGVDKSVVFAGGSLKLTNEELLRTIKAHPDRFLGACSLTSQEFRDSEMVKMTKDILSHDAIIGMKFYTGYEHYYPSDEGLNPVLEEIEKEGKFAIFHSGDTYNVKKDAKLKYAQPIHFDDVAVDHPELKVVIAHMGYPWHRDTAEVMYKNSNVYTDVSGFVYGEFEGKTQVQFQKVFEEFQFIYGSWDRLLFGSDFPISSQKSYIETLRDLGLFTRLRDNTNRVIAEVLKNDKPL
jgi:predicted TIM-barrel fold metal-dependent hydrolase